MRPCAPLLAAVFFASVASGAQTHGRFSIENFYSKDSSAAYDRSLLTARVRLDMTKLNEAGTISLHFDGSERLNLGAKDYADSTANDRIDIMDVEYAGERLFLSVGRFWPHELPIERVDGVNAVLRRGDYGMGVFGGYNPNPYTEAFTTAFTTAGAYLYYRKEAVGARLAYVHKGYKGATDRRYVYGELTYYPAHGVSVYTNATVDFNEKDLGARLTNGIVELTYRPDYTRSVTVGYNQFRAFRLFASMDFAVDDSRQEAYYVSANYRFKERYTLYARVERQTRYYPAVETQLDDAMVYGLGVSGSNLYDTGVNGDLNITLSDSYGSLHTTYGLQFDRYNWDVLQVIVHASYTQNEYGAGNNDDIVGFGVAGYLYVLKDWNLSASFDMEHGRDYDVKSFFTRASYRY
ncbi:MAG: hypothetical protein ACE5GY_07315 [Thermodesulfobacteriota bacterium]